MLFPNRAKFCTVIRFTIPLSLWIVGIFLLPRPAAANGIFTPADVLAAVNAEREQLGLAPLAINEQLRSAALAKARALTENQTFAHTIAQRGFAEWISDSGYRYQRVGENLAIHFSQTRPLLNAWLASPTHRDNMLHPDYTDTGIAVLETVWQERPTVLVVQVFGTPSPASQEPIVLGTASAGSPARFLAAPLPERYAATAATADLAGMPVAQLMEAPRFATEAETLQQKTIAMQSGWFIRWIGYFTAGYVMTAGLAVGIYAYIRSLQPVIAFALTTTTASRQPRQPA